MNVKPEGPYVYQPLGIKDKEHWKTGRIYGVGGVGGLLDNATIRGLTKNEAESVVKALAYPESLLRASLQRRRRAHAGDRKMAVRHGVCDRRTPRQVPRSLRSQDRTMKERPIIFNQAYRCGYCGGPTDAKGKVLYEIDETLDYDSADMTEGDCCSQRESERRYVTRDMAMDAGDPDLEGQLL